MFFTTYKNCSIIKKDSQFAAEGCSIFKVNTIRKHAESNTHKLATRKLQADENPGTSAARKALLALQKEQVAKLEKLFRNAHALAKKARPFSDFTWMCQLDKIKRLDVGSTYQNDKACAEFIDSIAKCEFNKTARMVRAAPFFSLSCDEA